MLGTVENPLEEASAIQRSCFRSSLITLLPDLVLTELTKTLPLKKDVPSWFTFLVTVLTTMFFLLVVSFFFSLFV